MQAPDVPPEPNRLILPAPEQLGVSMARSPSPSTERFDWNVAHQRVERLSAVAFFVGRRTDGGYTASFLLPTGQPGRTHHIETAGDSEAAAVARALEQAEAWNGRQNAVGSRQ